MKFIPPVKTVSAGSLAADYTSAAIDLRTMERLAIQANFTGTPTGTFSVEGSVDQTNWTALTLSGSLSASGSAGTVLIELATSCPYVRLKYTRSSGTGSLDVWISGKEV